MTYSVIWLNSQQQ